jgi:hypothetical protein
MMWRCGTGMTLPAPRALFQVATFSRCMPAWSSCAKDCLATRAAGEDAGVVATAFPMAAAAADDDDELP